MRAATLPIIVLLSACMNTPPPPPYGAFGQAPLAAQRQLRFNGQPASARDLQILAQLERSWGQRVLDGDYWYDDRSGAAGVWGGPVSAFLPAGLGLGGPLPPGASGGGTGIFINGREIHPQDRANLIALVGPVPPGRYWADSQGNAGPEGGPARVNLMQAAARQGGGGGGRAWSSHTNGLTGSSSGNISGASDGQTTCFTTAGRTVCTDGNN